MPASLDFNQYEPFWRDVVFADADKQHVMTFDTLKQAQYMRFRGYGFLRAVRKWYMDPTVSKELKWYWEETVKNAAFKEMVIREVGGKFELIVRPRLTTPIVIRTEEVPLDSMLPAARATVETKREEEELQKEWERNNPGVSPHAPSLADQSREESNKHVKELLDMFRVEGEK